MIVGHVYLRPVLQFSPPRLDVVETSAGRIAVPTKSRRLVFEPLRTGIPTKKLPTRYRSGRLRSKLDTEKEAKRLRIPVADLDAWIKAHPSYGLHMIAVDESSTQAVGDEGYGDGITDNGDGSFTCTLCDNKYLRDGRGLPGHITSKRHQEALEAERAGHLAAAAL